MNQLANIGAPAGVGLSCRSAICIWVSDDLAAPFRVLHEQDADRGVTPASITKLLTALTALRIASGRKIPPSMELTVTSPDIVAGSGRNVAEGDRFTFRDGLANLLLASSNIVANVIARAFGKILLGGAPETDTAAVERFVCEMNAVAKDIGMTGSRFLNPHGLAAKGQRSTARDLSVLVGKCLDYPVIDEFWGMERYGIAVGGPNARRMVVESVFRASTRKAVPDFAIPRFQGGKSGSLWPSVFNLAAVSAADAGGRIVSVTAGSPSVEARYTDYLAAVEIGNAALAGAGAAC